VAERGRIPAREGGSTGEEKGFRKRGRELINTDRTLLEKLLTTFEKLKGQSSNQIVDCGEKKIENYKIHKVKPDFCSWPAERSLEKAPKRLRAKMSDACGWQSTLVLIT